MKKLIITALALTITLSFSNASAQSPRVDVGLGGGLILDNTVPGGGALVKITIPDKPIVVGLTGEYFTKNSVSRVPIGFFGAYNAPISDGKASVFVGGGAGFFRTSVDIPSVTIFGSPVGGGSASSTDGMGTILGGINVQGSEDSRIGAFAKVQLYIVSGGSDVSIAGGISINIIPASE
jgi:hypothetical protein